MDKIRRFQAAMPENMEAAIFRDPANRFYLTGMRSSAGTVVITKKYAWLIIDFRYLEEAQREVKNCGVLEEKDVYEQIRTLLMAEGISRVSIHSGETSMEEYQTIKERISPLTVDGTSKLRILIESLRAVEEEDEVACHRKAQQITDHVFSHICGFIRPGMTELDVSREIGVMLTTLGSDDRNFNFIVASGENSSLPHGFATNRMIRNGDFVTMDFGAVYGGYLADMTRTVAVGHISDEQKKVYETVYEAQKRAFDCIHPGAVCKEVDAAARTYIYEMGYRGCFSHGLGHSVGVVVHENPRFNEMCEERLVPGIVITVEPGIYLKGRFGVRIEDMIVVRENGFENLAKSPKKLIVL
ncbi:MAG: aminopeptidase P family protein [Lachnospiraceae bacterium]|nr:aminopeptidase P family protein [Lachnospiraceae bacterium]